ncbi:beta-fructofuranosidase, insoluble isoenzyme CWINV1-like [Malania oleifera]|uniref:beta-fructofuranosidase, insoluble isoenzyme CWINV1-like n=1 Tax=Malania oleifera TaxID=397392 RepID=UPI0025ADDA21|nr:beta-fructofuranosidase, insoluble isoenzyme CWINV1-like [Malania oleifera]
MPYTSHSHKPAMAALSFATLLLCLFSLLLSHAVVELEASHHVYRNLQSLPSNSSAYQPYRTSYHFQPPKNWINGVMIYKGIYHLFYQYNPLGAVWGNIVWAHSTSKDLINWIPHDPAISPSQPSDINGCWSGSTTILPGDKPVILYTGINPQNQQVQNLAMPKNLSDPYLREWIKSPHNPLMAPTPINKINASSFRDPTTAWKGPDGRWRVIVGNKRRKRGMAILYRSKDFVNWAKAQHPLHSSNDNGMWECPDFYPVQMNSSKGVDTSMIGSNIKHVLKVSLDDTKHEYYTIGTYYHDKDNYVPDKGSVDNDSGLRYDYGKFYASKTFFDSSTGRRILWGWINESSSEKEDIKKGWSGVQAIPRSIWLDKSGKQLVQWPVAEIEKLHENQAKMRSIELKGGSTREISGVKAIQADVEISFKITDFKEAEFLDPSWKNPQELCGQKGASVKGGLGPFGLLVLASKGLQEHTAVFFRIFRAQKGYVVLMCSDQSRSSLNEQNDKTTYGAFVDLNPVLEEVSLRSLVDHSIVESFGGGGKSCITARVYPLLAVEDEAHLHAFNNGTAAVTISRLSASSMKKAQIS